MYFRHCFLTMPSSSAALHCETSTTHCHSPRAKGRKGIGTSAEIVRSTSSTENNEIQTDESNSFHRFVETKLSSGTISDLITLRTLRSFASAPGVISESGSFADTELNIRNWLARLVAAPTAPATVRRYLGKLHALYTEFAGPTPEAEDLFALLRTQALTASTTDPFRGALPFVKRIPMRMERFAPDETVVAALLLFMLYSGGIPLRQAVEARFDDKAPQVQQLQNIIEKLRARRPKARYIFPLEQGRHRPEHLDTLVSRRLTSLLRYLGFQPEAPVTADAVAGWWIDTALAKGLPLPKIAAAVSSIPPSHSWLSLVKPAALPHEERLSILQNIANALNPNTSQWFALALRGRNTPADIQALLREADPALAGELHFFYPTHTLYKEAGRKRIKEEVPYLPHILFVRTRPDRVLPLMKAVGSLAWCYKTHNSPEAPYSVIPWKSMVDFQKFIGVLDDETRIEFVRNPALLTGTRVLITGGRFAGCQGEILRQAPPTAAGNGSKAAAGNANAANSGAGAGNGADEDADPAMRTFILRIANDITLRWEARIPEPFLSPL